MMLYIQFLLFLRNVKDLRHECGNVVSHRMMGYRRIRFGPLFASEIRMKRVQQLRT